MNDSLYLPVVSVVMPLYNKGFEVARAIRSVQEQSVSAWELVVVDDGSTDAGPSVVAEFSDSRLRMVRQENAGVSAARNRGVAEARSELIAFIDADDEWKPDFLATVLRLGRNCPNCDIFATAYLYSTPEGKQRNIYFRGLPAYPWEGVKNFPFSYDLDPPISMSALAVTKKAITAVGGFPVGITVSEDVLFKVRLMLSFQLAYSTNPCSVYWFPASVPANRKPQYPDVVGEQLHELLDNGAPPQLFELSNILRSWHRRRGIMNITFGESRKAMREFKAAIATGGLNLDLSVLAILVFLPSKISRNMLSLLLKVKTVRRMFLSFSRKG